MYNPVQILSSVTGSLMHLVALSLFIKRNCFVFFARFLCTRNTINDKIVIVTFQYDCSQNNTTNLPVIPLCIELCSAPKGESQATFIFIQEFLQVCFLS